MQILALDYETYYTDAESGYTLSRMSTEAYIRDERFEALCLGFHWHHTAKLPEDWNAKWGLNAGCVPREDIPEFLTMLARLHANGEQFAVLHHHAHFDAAVSMCHYGYSPWLLMDTLSMARAVLPRGSSLSLAGLADRYGLPEKTVPYNLFRNKRWHELDRPTRHTLMEGATHDCWLNLAVLDRVYPQFPRSELYAVDWTVRMFSEPTLVGDGQKFLQLAEAERAKKEQIVSNLGLTRTDFASADKFKALLQYYGVLVEYKKNATGKVIPAFAKNDSFMKSLLDYELQDTETNERIQAMGAARLAIRSTIHETRAYRFYTKSTRGGGFMPLYYNAYAAHTHRHGGGDGDNPQNISRTSGLREGFKAPAGYKVLAIDKSQIECRVLNAVAGQEDVLEKFRYGVDVYKDNASRMYGISVEQVDAQQRGSGKQVELSCGYQCGGLKYQATAALGVYGPPVKIELAEANDAVTFYRDGHPFVVRLWAQGRDILKEWRAKGINGRYEFCGCPLIDGKLHLPNGLIMDYSEYRWDDVLETHFVKVRRAQARCGLSDSLSCLCSADERVTWYNKRGFTKLYGGAWVENVIQALAGVAYREAVTRVWRQLGIRPAMTVHDEAVYVVHETKVDELAPLVHKLFVQQINWLPNCPVAAEHTIKDEYAK
jgi:hypothetical protein